MSKQKSKKQLPRAYERCLGGTKWQVRGKVLGVITGEISRKVQNGIEARVKQKVPCSGSVSVHQEIAFENARMKAYADELDILGIPYELVWEWQTFTIDTADIGGYEITDRDRDVCSTCGKKIE
jgi:hypothetical protein